MSDNQLTPSCWGRYSKSHRMPSDNRVPFRCDGRCRKIAWRCIDMVLRDGDWPVCCGRIMEMLDGYEAGELRDKRAAGRKA